MSVPPALPLIIVIFVAFALLVVSVISAPIVKDIPIGSVNGVHFGIFGSCKQSTCSQYSVGYQSEDYDKTAGGSDSFSLSRDVRHPITPLLIVHPIAAFLSLICLAMAISIRFYGPAQSPRFFLILFIALLLTFLVTLLAFLVDVLLFVPHVGWAGWIVLVSTVLLALAGIFTCAMRRTLLSRQATTRRLEEDHPYSPDTFTTKEPIKEDYKSQATYAPSSTGESGHDHSNSMELSPLATDDDRHPLKPMKSSPSPHLNHLPTTISSGYPHSVGNVGHHLNHVPSSASGSSYSTATTQIPSGRPPNMPFAGPVPEPVHRQQSSPAMSPPFPIAGLYPQATGVGDPAMRPIHPHGPHRIPSNGYMGRGMTPPPMRSTPSPAPPGASRSSVNGNYPMSNGSNPHLPQVPISGAPYGPRGTPPPRPPPGYNHQDLELQLSLARNETGMARSITPASDISDHNNNNNAPGSNIPYATRSTKLGSTFNASEFRRWSLANNDNAVPEDHVAQPSFRHSGVPHHTPSVASAQRYSLTAGPDYYEHANPRFSQPQLTPPQPQAVSVPSVLQSGPQQSPQAAPPGYAGELPIEPSPVLAPGPFIGHYPGFPGYPYPYPYPYPCPDAPFCSSSQSISPHGETNSNSSISDSHFTSVSQRGINPRWRPYEELDANHKHELVLASNPDFALPCLPGPPLSLANRSKPWARTRGPSRNGRLSKIPSSFGYADTSPLLNEGPATTLISPSRYPICR